MSTLTDTDHAEQAMLTPRPTKPHRFGRRSRAAASALAGLVALSLASGCGLLGGGGSEDKVPPAGRGGGSAPSPGQTTSRSSPPPAKAGGPFSDDQLAEASQATFRGLTQSYEPETGAYGSMSVAEVAIGPQNVPAGVKISPSGCKDALWAGPPTPVFGKNHAAFTHHIDQEAESANKPAVVAWSVVIAAAGKDPKSALGKSVSRCARMRLTARGTTSTLTERPAPKTGAESRATIFATSDGSSPKTWIVGYTGNGYVGMLMVQGPAKATQVDAFAKQAVQHARQTLGG